MKSSFCIDLQRFMLIPTKFPLIRHLARRLAQEEPVSVRIKKADKCSHKHQPAQFK